MKKITNLLSVILSVVIFLSVFTITPSAVSSKSSAKEMLNYYETCIDKTAKKSVIKSERIDYEKLVGADYSDLSKLDAEKTAERDNKVLNKWIVDESLAEYSGCGFYNDYEVKSAYSIRQYIDGGIEKLKSATYTKAQNGDFSIVFVTHSTSSESVYKYKTKFNKNGYLKYYEMTDSCPISSIKESVYEDTYSADVCYGYGDKLSYEKVPAKSITLSHTDVTIGYKDTFELAAYVGPENATFKEFFYEYTSPTADLYPFEIVTVEEDYLNWIGPLQITGENEGTVEIVCYTVDTKQSASCTVTVEFSGLDRIRFLFDRFVETIVNYFLW